jgi:hypothetical protein
MRYLVAALLMFTCPLTSAIAQVSVGVGVRLPGVSIGIDMPAYPAMEPVPGYPVYYAPGASSNYFFYDGMFWVYQGDGWYSSPWYNGPWMQQSSDSVPLFVLRVPVRYYRRPPAYFAGWRSDAPPRWGEHWGADWQQHHRGWDTWNRRAAPRPAPLPSYQRQYSGARYPPAEQQNALHDRNYQYRPHDTAVRQAYQAQGLRDRTPPARPGNNRDQSVRSPQQPAAQHASPGSSNAMAPHPKQPVSKGHAGGPKDDARRPEREK